VTREEKSKSREEEARKTAEHQKQFDLLRQLRAELQDLQTLLSQVREGKAALNTYAGYIVTNREEINKLFAAITGQNIEWAVLEGDDLRHIHNQWQKLFCSPVIATPDATISAEAQTKELAICEQFCQEAVAKIGFVTIPARLNRWLLQGWNGYLLPFHDLFSDELPRLQDRQLLLRVLAASPGIIQGGIVEPTSGLIFPYHFKMSARLFTCFLLLAGYLLATVGIWCLGIDAKLFQMTSSDLVLNWALVILGVLTHYVVERSKDSGVGGPAAIPLGHPTYVIDARAGIVLMKGLLMLIGFFGLLKLAPQQNHGHLNFFLVGYSLDSFVGIVSTSLDRRAAEQSADLKKQM
jgi:hypothetical protein